MHPFVRAVLFGMRGQNALVLNAEPHPPHVKRGEPVQRREANGTPLSVRMARGRPYSRNSRSKTGRTPSPLVESRP